MVRGNDRHTTFFNVRDRVTEQSGNVRQVLFAVHQSPKGAGMLSILKDWEALDLLNELLQSKNMDCDESQVNSEELQLFFDRARKELKDRVSDFDLPFELPEVIPLAVIASCLD